MTVRTSGPARARRTVRAPRRLRPAAALVLPAVLVLGACSDGEEEPAADPGTGDVGSAAAVDEDVLRAELADAFVGDDDAPNARREGRCFADALLERVDVAALAGAGVLDADGHLLSPLPALDRGTAEQWVDAQESCLDFVTASTRALTAQSKGRLDGEVYQDCLADEIAPDEIRAALVAALSSGMQGDAVARLAEAQGTCTTRALPED